jgi:hypothetical protein
MRKGGAECTIERRARALPESRLHRSAIRCDAARCASGLKAYVEGATVRRLVEAVRTANLDGVRAMLKARPELGRMSIDNLHIPSKASPLHVAAQVLDGRLVEWLLDHGADSAVRAHRDLTPLDVAAHRWYRTDTQQFEKVATLLLGRGAPMAAAAAAALGDADWLRARHAEGTLTDQNDGGRVLASAVGNRLRVGRDRERLRLQAGAGGQSKATAAAIHQKLDRLDEAFLFAQAIDADDLRAATRQGASERRTNSRRRSTTRAGARTS